MKELVGGPQPSLIAVDPFDTDKYKRIGVIESLLGKFLSTGKSRVSSKITQSTFQLGDTYEET